MTVGSSEISIPAASTVADPVVSVNHQTSANWATLLPMSDSCCPIQIQENEVRHLEEDDSVGSSATDDSFWISLHTDIMVYRCTGMAGTECWLHRFVNIVPRALFSGTYELGAYPGGLD
jgi:hypothetical protein